MNPGASPGKPAPEVRVERERALVGAALLDECVCRLLVTELDPTGFVDPTARRVFETLRDALEVDRLLARDGLPSLDEQIEAELGPPGPTRLDAALADLAEDGLLEAAGGLAAVRALLDDRPALRRALEATRAALAHRAPPGEEPIVALAAALFDAREVSPVTAFFAAAPLPLDAIPGARGPSSQAATRSAP